MNKKISLLFVGPTNTIVETMRVINKAAENKIPVGIALVVDESESLLGVVTDGDIRKNLANGKNLNDNVSEIMSTSPIIVKDYWSTEEILDKVLLQAKNKKSFSIDFMVNHIILVNDLGKITDIIDFNYLWNNRNQIRRSSVSVIGVGYIGLILSVNMADAGFFVVGIDTNEALIEKLNKGNVEVFEKGLQSILNFHLKKESISFKSRVRNSSADIYFITVGTPISDKDKKPNIEHIKSAAQSISSFLKQGDIVILRSTVPTGTTRNIVKPILEDGSDLKAGRDFYLAFAPERLVEGNALEEAHTIPQVIGGFDKRSAQQASRILQTISPSLVVVDSLEEAEMVKLLNNSFRDLSFAFANHAACICEKFNIDSIKLINAANEGYPRNAISLPSPGVGGYCLTKDPYILASVAEKHGLTSDIFSVSRNINANMPVLVSNKITAFINKKYDKSIKIKIYILGFAFKGYPETSDIRESPSISILHNLRNSLNYEIDFCGYDPIVTADVIKSLGVNYMEYEDGFKNAACVLVLNNNQEFEKINIFEHVETMRKPGLVFDGWHIYPSHKFSQIPDICWQGLGITI